MIYYLAGPMTGLPQFNFPAFDALAARLRASGHDAKNPAENFGGRNDLPTHVYLRRDYANLLTCQAVALLEGWEDSRGALKELLFAVTAGIPVYEARAVLDDRLVPVDLTEEMLVERLHQAVVVGAGVA